MFKDKGGVFKDKVDIFFVEHTCRWCYDNFMKLLILTTLLIMCVTNNLSRIQ